MASLFFAGCYASCCDLESSGPFACGHLSDQVITFAEDVARHLPRPMRFLSTRADPCRNRGCAVGHARDQPDDRFLIVNGDLLFDTDIASFLVDPWISQVQSRMFFCERRMTSRDTA